MNDQPLPDIAAQATHHALPLDWVGMAGIALPIRLADAAVTASVDIGVSIELQVEVAYSSTCPCSAALARQLIQQRFAWDFPDQQVDYSSVLDWLGSTQGIVATPHSQRSTATLQLRLAPGCVELPVLALIDSAEQALGTPVQTAVKRADEQAFALANGQNLMFCEDAARRLHRTLRQLPQACAFRLKVVHAESLHAHDAVAQSRWS